MAKYRVLARHGVWLMLPTGATVGNRPLWENRSFPLDFILPDGARPEAIAHMLASGLIAEVTD